MRRTLFTHHSTIETVTVSGCSAVACVCVVVAVDSHLQSSSCSCIYVSIRRWLIFYQRGQRCWQCVTQVCVCLRIQHTQSNGEIEEIPIARLSRVNCVHFLFLSSIMDSASTNCTMHVGIWWAPERLAEEECGKKGTDDTMNFDILHQFRSPHSYSWIYFFVIKNKLIRRIIYYYFIFFECITHPDSQTQLRECHGPISFELVFLFNMSCARSPAAFQNSFFNGTLLTHPLN